MYDEPQEEPATDPRQIERPVLGDDDIDSDDLAQYDDRIAGSGDDSDTDDGEFDDIAQLENQLRAEGVQDRDDWSGSEEVVSDEEHSDDDMAHHKRLANNSKMKGSKTAASMKWIQPSGENGLASRPIWMLLRTGHG